MFKRLADKVPNGADLLSKLHPLELTALIEKAWNIRVHEVSSPIGHPDHRSETPGLDIPQTPLPVIVPPNPASPDPAGRLWCDHWLGLVARRALGLWIRRWLRRCVGFEEQPAIPDPTSTLGSGQ